MKTYQNKLLIFAIAIEILLTQSSTAYGALLIVGLILILFSDDFTLKQKAFIVILGIAGFLVLYFGFYSLLDAVIFSKEQTGSYSTRVRYNNTALEAFFSSPIIGIGYKNCRGSSIFYSLLGQMGIIGLTIYFIFNLYIYLSGIIGSKYSDTILTASKFGVLTTMVGINDGLYLRLGGKRYEELDFSLLSHERQVYICYQAIVACLFAGLVIFSSISLDRKFVLLACVVCIVVVNANGYLMEMLLLCRNT